VGSAVEEEGALALGHNDILTPCAVGILRHLTWAGDLANADLQIFGFARAMVQQVAADLIDRTGVGVGREILEWPEALSLAFIF